MELRPVIVQEVNTKEVLMLAYANEEALKLTMDTGFAHFYSRSRNSIWKKGETSGNTMKVVKIFEDCDRDTLLYLVEFPKNKVACHTGNRTCFFNEIFYTDKQVEREEILNFWNDLFKIIKDRKEKMPEGSYTAQLFREGIDRIMKKFGEEAIEVMIAAKDNSIDEFIYECADLIYHLTVLMVEVGVEPNDIMLELFRRHIHPGQCKN
ncbi:MAG: phosphoribosyl-AMP cyclohydrolase / phosphoribosyl-ATP pyrophosphohydrolase [Thermotogaceae bacterium]|nr:phosphoribosyl-AMP cyclohydrolase / phosphoribosyl-ATP pyrophosphohydrolase [Thermotogaceae bacterium]